MFIASPASAEIINLYDLRNFLYYGSSNLGKGIDGESDPYIPSCDASKGEFDSLPSNMTCQSFKKGSITCYRNCSCSSEFKYDDSNCPSAQRFVRSGQTCDGKSKSCSCSDEAVDGRLSMHFYGLTTETAGVDNEVTCYYADNITCIKGKNVEASYYKNADSKSKETTPLMFLFSYKNEPVQYRVWASSETIDSNTVFCIESVDVKPGFERAATMVLKSTMPYYNCGKVSDRQSAMLANYLSSPSDGMYYYYTGDMTDRCVSSYVDGYASEIVYWFDPNNGSVRNTTFYQPTCTIGYGVSSMDYATARDRYSSLQYIDISVSELSNGNACVTFNGCKNGAVPFEGTNGINFETVNASGMVDKARLDSRLASLIPDKTFESEVSYISYPDDASDTSLAGKSTLYFCYKETGCKVPEDDENVSIACYEDSELITALNKPAGSVGYTASASDTCDGVKLLHPISTNSAVCLPTSCGEFVTGSTGSNTVTAILGSTASGSTTLRNLRTMLNTHVCPYGLCNADAILGDVKSNGYVIGNDKAYSYVAGKVPTLVTSDTVQIQNGNYIHVKCKQMPVIAK